MGSLIETVEMLLSVKDYEYYRHILLCDSAAQRPLAQQIWKKQLGGGGGGHMSRLHAPRAPSPAVLRPVSSAISPAVLTEFNTSCEQKR